MCNAALELLRSHPNLMASNGINKSSIIRWLQSFRPQRQGFIDDICSKAGISIPYLDGNQWCILKGDNIQSGVVGFGDTKEDALANFIKDVPIQQKWGKEDEIRLKEALGVLSESIKYLPIGYGFVEDVRLVKDWLKSLPERFNFQPKQEWREEDEEMLNSCISSIEESKENRYAYKETDGDTSYDHEIAWLKSLRPQPYSEWRHYIWATNLRFDFTALIKYDNTDNYEIVQAGNRPKQEKNGVYILIKDIKPQPSWKPSEEQMKALNALNLHGDLSYVGQQNQLISLYQDLKKLM